MEYEGRSQFEVVLLNNSGIYNEIDAIVYGLAREIEMYCFTYKKGKYYIWSWNDLEDTILNARTYCQVEIKNGTIEVGRSSTNVKGFNLCNPDIVEKLRDWVTSLRY